MFVSRLADTEERTGELCIRDKNNEEPQVSVTSYIFCFVYYIAVRFV